MSSINFKPPHQTKPVTLKLDNQTIINVPSLIIDPKDVTNEPAFSGKTLDRILTLQARHPDQTIIDYNLD